MAAIRQPLVLPKRDGALETVEWNRAINARDDELGPYSTLLRRKRAFVVGGLGLVIDCGLVNDWYRNDATRQEAMELIDARGCRPLLDALSDKDVSGSIFGKNDLRAFFRNFPSVVRTGAFERSEPPSLRTLRREFPLRLRKAIEFLFLTEAVLRFRFRLRETMSRFEKVTGTAVSSTDDAIRVWEYMWIEPLLYVVDPDPRPPDVARIIDKQWYTSERFVSASGQRPTVLYSVLRGVPASFDTATVAAAACADFYGPSAAPTSVMAVPAGEFDARMDRLLDSASLKQGSDAIENILRLAPRD